jgi:heme-degrading monooxygenase HmoA
MIARIWHGRTRAKDADVYLEYIKETGIRGARAVPGNLGAQVWRSVRGDEAEFQFVSFWPSMDAVRRFAGDDVEKAVYYPRDREYLLELEPHVRHYEVLADEK